MTETRPSLYAEVLGGAALSVPKFKERLQEARETEGLTLASLVDLGNELYAAELYDRARECFLLAAIDDGSPGIELRLGQCENRLGEATHAERRARRLLQRHEFVVSAWLLLAESLIAQEAFKAALHACNQAIAHVPGDARVYSVLGLVFERLGDVESARDAYHMAVELNPDNPAGLSTLVFIKRKLCDWKGLDELGARLQACVAHDAGDVSPFAFMAEGATPAQELACARAFARRFAQLTDRVAAWPRRYVAHEPLRIGFVSYKFGEHACTILTSAFLEQLQRLGPQVHLFATNADRGSAPRRRLQKTVHQLHDMARRNPYEIAERIRATGIDVLIDLDGYGKEAVPRVFALRCAPIQAGWVGYPCTSGAPYMDYVIADRFVLPESLRRYFSEKVVYLPRCFQPSDPTRHVRNPLPREACGLPDRGVVYACFNAGFKINPRSFARMLRVLNQVPGSVLWLLRGDGRASERLCDAAKALGVDASRLVFMDKKSHSKYLACFRHVDLFLDTEHYGAHTVASDALWAGCPVLTRPGETFAQRVAGSLNHHLGINECNVDSDEAFVAEAVRYGLDAQARAVLRAKVDLGRRESGLFDMAAYARDFLTLLGQLVAEHRTG